MNRWRGTWAAAQITGVTFSSLVWIVVCGLSLRALVVTAAIGVALVIGRNTRLMLWWRFGAAPANAFQRDTILTAIVPIASLRGRHQPSVWIGRRIIGTDIAMPASSILIVSPQFAGQVANGQLTDRQASAIISQTLGTVEVVDSTPVNMLDAYCMPWRIVQILIAMESQFAARHRTLRISWSIRWIVFGVAIVDNYLKARWAAFIGVVLIAVLSWTTGNFQKRWNRRCQDLGDQRTIDDGLGPDLANMIQRGDRSAATSQRADRLRGGNHRVLAAPGNEGERRAPHLPTEVWPAREPYVSPGQEQSESDGHRKCEALEPELPVAKVRCPTLRHANTPLTQLGSARGRSADGVQVPPAM